MPRELFAVTKNHHNVFLDTKRSHALRHFQNNPQLAAYAKRAIAGVSVKVENIMFDVNMGRVVGLSDCVETDESDVIVYAKREGQSLYARFVKERQPVPTQFVTVVLQKRGSDYGLRSAWPGRAVPPFPGSPLETPESYDFWSRHALVWGRQPVQAGTERKDCPW